MGELFKTFDLGDDKFFFLGGGKWGPHMIHDILHEQILGLLHLQHLGLYFLLSSKKEVV